MKLNPPETAPKDETVFLASIGWPWLLPCVWNPHDEKWTYPTLQASQMEDGKTDYWWETESDKESDLKGWTPLPDKWENHN